MTSDGNEDCCALCERALGERIERHHLVPRALGGRVVVLLHPICHRKIHSLFRDRELKARYATIPALRAHPKISRFLDWIKDKDPDFHKRTSLAAGRRR